MPCSFCGTAGHNRRTCQIFDLLSQERNRINIEEEEIEEIEEIEEEEEIENRVFRDAQIRQELEQIQSELSEIERDRINRGIENRVFRNAQMIQELEQLHIQIQIPIHSPTAFITPPMTPSYNINNLNMGNIDVMDIWDDDSISPIKQLFIDNPLVICANEPCSADNCAICMEDLTSVDLMITRCGHQFHSTCMITHLKRQDNCPLCRGILCN